MNRLKKNFFSRKSKNQKKNTSGERKNVILSVCFISLDLL